MQDPNTDEPGAAQVAGADPSPVPTVRHVYCPRTGVPIPVALAEKRAARQRTLNTPAKQQSRARQRAAEAADEAATMTEVSAVLADLDMTGSRLTLAQALAEARLWRVWLEGDGAQQRQYRKKAKRYLIARRELLRWRNETWDDPEPAEFAPRLAKALNEPICKDKSRDVLRALAKLEGAGGPWRSTSS